MAKVPLRKYNREIESLIEHGQTDELIAHCRHILKTFPKHLETYRLLGKAYLESKHHAEATDIFNRILVVVPDDFVSHVGLSIIADDQKRMEDAIWHMERAFEKQPSNAAIQAELQRLYGRRDGREPPKIRLNRGALAHMYYQGELYMQAVNEIRSVLAEDPSRADLQCLLALAYFRAGQKVEASEICSQLLGQFPYCLDANRALVEILPGTGLAEDASIYRQRVVELDPYAAHVRGSIFQTDDVPDDAVTLERLDYKGKPVEISPDWGKSLGIGLGAAAATAAGAQPDWLKNELESIPASTFPKELRDEVELPGATAEPEAPSPDVLGPIMESKEPEQPGSEAIPGWMRSAGWGESTGAFDESAVSTSEETSGETTEGELAKADLPDWIKSMAPKESELTPAAPSTPDSLPMDEETREWLNKLGGDKPFGSIPASETSPEETLKAAQPDDVPDWLSNLETASRDSLIPPAANTPDWLSHMEDADQAASTADWLSKLDNEDAPIAESRQEIPPAAEPVSPIPPAAIAGMGNLGTSAAEQDAALLWLENLAAKQGAKSEELLTKPEDRLVKPPEWVEQAVEQTREVPEVPIQAEPLPEPVSGTPQQAEPLSKPDWGEADVTEAAPSEVAGLDRTGAWLSELEGKESGSEKTFDVDSTAWSGEIEITPPAVPPSAEAAFEEEIPTWLRGTDGKTVSPVTGSLGDMPEWMRGQDREEPATPEPTHPADWTPEAEVTPTLTAPEPPKPTLRKLEPKPRSTSELKFELKPEPNIEPKSEPKPQLKAQVKPEPKPQAKPAPKPEAAAKEEFTKVRRNGMLPSLIDPNLVSAREAMSRGKIPDALQAYGSLIHKGKVLEDITFDLKEALYRFPVEVSIWQTLGDAYMRSNRLQDALDAYTKAEELLR
jgi:tetratricopeptide (TPR) repeat protein